MIKSIITLACAWLLAAGTVPAAGDSQITSAFDAQAVKTEAHPEKENREDLPEEKTADNSRLEPLQEQRTGSKTEKTEPEPKVLVEIKSETAVKPPPLAQVEIKKTDPLKPERGKTPAAGSERRIAVNVASRMLMVYEGNRKVRIYPIGAGTAETPTPPGFYAVQTKEIDPVWIDPDDMEKRVPTGPDNPLGYRWIGFSGNYGIHGTNAPETIGEYVSNGCIRMLEEDVEELYSLVSVGTPVIVYYDRIVIDSTPDHTVSYYIYPDGYRRQDLSTADVRRALAGYGVDNFVSDSEIAEKIAASDGQATYVAKAYDLLVNGRKLDMRALKRGEILYLPAVAVATALQLDLRWDGGSYQLASPYGAAPGIIQQDVVYVNADYAGRLFRLDGRLTADWKYEMKTRKEKNAKTPPAATVVITSRSEPAAETPSR